MNLHNKQLLFGELFPRFILILHDLGYQVKIGEVKRTKNQAKLNELNGTGISNSLHTKLLAADIELYKNYQHLTQLDDYKEAAEIWEKMHGYCRSGYYFGDGHHFSITHEGIK